MPLILGAAVWVCMPVLSGCASSDPVKAMIMDTNDGTRFIMSAKIPWNDTGQRLQKGHTYRLTAHVQAGEEYKDMTVACTPDGPASAFGRLLTAVARDATCALNPARLLGPGRIKRLRVLHDRTGRSASFLTLIATINRDDREENVYVIGSGRTFTAHASGELVVFSNDWPGGPGASGDARFEHSKSYDNNHGHLVITIEEM